MAVADVLQGLRELLTFIITLGKQPSTQEVPLKKNTSPASGRDLYIR